jgi:hypothetical protein
LIEKYRYSTIGDGCAFEGWIVLIEKRRYNNIGDGILIETLIDV